ncbi:MAG TPA: cobalamin biosynthesis protein CobW [Stellaceae bacterium]|jgi:cobalamin biosynthesis protein CobW|nr:cobalamin biosynthesis protein CobW [Stellaceae bacterium]
MMRKIPATVITGFLGAGKTSLLRHLVAHANGRRLALVINEFGELGVDREILMGCGVENCREDDVIELANGCICCTVADDFLPTLERLIDRPDPPDHILIETSGLALPKPLVQAFAWPEVKARVTVDGVIAVVDAAAVAAGRFATDPAALAAQRAADPALDHDNPLAEVFEDQLTAADLVVLNKTDLLAADALAAVRRDLSLQKRAATKLIAASHGVVAPALLLGLDAAAEDDLASRPSHHDLEPEHDHDDFESFVVARGPVVDTGGFLARLGDVIAAHDILRLKGFLHVPGKDFRQVVQGVGARLQHYFDRPWDAGEPRQSRLVVIGRKGLDRSAIAAAIEA